MACLWYALDLCWFRPYSLLRLGGVTEMLDVIVFLLVLHGVTLAVSSFLNVPGYILLCKRHGLPPILAAIGAIPGIGHGLFFHVLSKKKLNGLEVNR